MNEKEFAGLKRFEYSLVNFIPDMLKNFFDGTIDEETFKQKFLYNLKSAKINLVLMSKADIDTNKKVFRNEFIMADKINAAIVDEKLSGQKLKDKLKKFVMQYNDNNLE